MSMISEQIEELRLMAEMFVNGEPYGNLLIRAANTIEMLSEKARADRPQGEWIIHYRDKWMVRAECPKCHRRFEFSSRVIWKCCPMCETRMKGVYDEVR